MTFLRISLPLFSQLLSSTSSRRTFILLFHLPCFHHCTRTPLLTLSSPQSFPAPIYLLLQPSKKLTHAFSNIFNYLPSDTHLKIGHTTFIFSSPQSSVIHLTDIFPLMGTSFTISAPAKLRTSDHNRNMTLKLHAVYLEISTNTLVTTDSYYLLIEKYHPNSNTVTVYDPILGSHIKQVTSLVLYKPLLLIFKRGSQPSLICPKLLQRFALTSPSSLNSINLFQILYYIPF